MVDLEKATDKEVENEIRQRRLEKARAEMRVTFGVRLNGSTPYGDFATYEEAETDIVRQFAQVAYGPNPQTAEIVKQFHRS